jgi:hypothetical protein
MCKNDEDFKSRVGESLGASRVVPLPGLPSAGPLDLLQLRAHLAHRLKSTGGRPTDPEWDVQRLVPFRGQRWKQLEELAGQLSTADRKVGPGQLAAILIERVLEEIGAGPQER